MKDPKKAIVNVSFIGGSVVEVLTDSSCKSQTLQELKEADLTHNQGLRYVRRLNEEKQRAK